MIQAEFDADQLPSHNFQFKVDGLRVSSAQEKRHVVADINRNGKKVEIVRRLALPVARNYVSPSANVSHYISSKQESVVSEEPVACMDPSKSTISGRNLFKPVNNNGEAAGAGDVSGYSSPKPTDGVGVLPQKRSAKWPAASVAFKKNASIPLVL